MSNLAVLKKWTEYAEDTLRVNVMTGSITQNFIRLLTNITRQTNARYLALTPLVTTVFLVNFSASIAADEATAYPPAVRPAQALPFDGVAFDILAHTLPMETVKGAGNVPAMAEYLQGLFVETGFPAADVRIIPYETSDEVTSVLLVRYRGDGRSGRKPILFASHMDVVPAKPSDWVRDPFLLTEDDVFYYGRGVLDNKFDIAILSATFLRLKAEGFVPSRDLILAFTGDEETAQKTALMLTTQYRDEIDAEYAFVVDGGGGQLDDDGGAFQFLVGSAEKTYATFTVTARNPGGHSSLPRSDNAIFDIADAIAAIQSYQFPVRTSELTRTYFARTANLLTGDIADAMARFAADPSDNAAIAILRSRPDTVGTLSTTCVPTLIEGGHAENALPQSATVTVNCRIYPGISVPDTLLVLQSVVANPALEWGVLDEPVWSDASPLNNEVFEAISVALEPAYPGVPVIPQMLSGATDGVHFRAAGIPSYSMTGIFLNSADDYAHGLNERVTKFSLPQSMAFWGRMIDQLAN